LRRLLLASFTFTMSLKRILNDGPSGPPPPPPRVSVSEPIADAEDRARISPHQVHHSPLIGIGNPNSAARESSNGSVPLDRPPQPRGFWNQAPGYQVAGGWNPYTGEWVQGDIFPLGRGGNYYPDRAREAEGDEQREGTPDPDRGLLEAEARKNEDRAEGNGRSKRRKTAEPEEEMQPKRVSGMSAIIDVFY
jgi:chromatin-remodeling ATPase INO80